MVFFLLAIQLLSFTPPTQIPVDYGKCEAGQIIIIKGETKQSIRLFNVAYTEKGYEYACLRINQAKRITYVVDPLVNQDYDLQVWLFLEGELLQKDLISKGFATVEVNNPTYLYQKECEEAANSLSVISQNTNSVQDIGYHQNRGKILLIVLFCGTIFLSLSSVFIVRKLRKKG